MSSYWVPWVVVLSPGGICLVLAAWSLFADGWKDLPTVEALEHLALHAVFYSPAFVAATLGLYFPSEQLKSWGLVIGLLSVPVGGAFFAMGRQCIAKGRQLEQLEHLARQIAHEQAHAQPRAAT